MNNTNPNSDGSSSSGSGISNIERNGTGGNINGSNAAGWVPFTSPGGSERSNPTHPFLANSQFKDSSTDSLQSQNNSNSSVGDYLSPRMRAESASSSSYVFV